MEVSLMEMLEAREKRAAVQRELLARYRKVLVCFTMNIAGPIKSSPLIDRGYALGKGLLLRQLEVAGIPVLHAQESRGNTGSECMLVVEGSPRAVKAAATDLEDYAPVGRLFDMDVLTPEGRKLERQELGLPGRKCLLCGESAQVCARSRRHTVAQLQAETERILTQALWEADSQEAARLACQALLFEVAVTPKPGLVDRQNSGSHRDMDFFTFQASVPALYPYFVRCTEIGREAETPEAAFQALRLPGKMAEGEMRRATGGVNTHKGAIFSMGIVCAALGRLPRESWANPHAILSECAAMTAGLVRRDFAGLTQENAKTAGQKFYLQYGITGVRGQAEAGFPAVEAFGLPMLERALAAGLSWNDAGCAALLALMSETQDTNLLHRGGYDAMVSAAETARALLAQEEFPRREALEALDAQFREANLSPGGTADLLALTFFLHFLKTDSHTIFEEDAHV